MTPKEPRPCLYCLEAADSLEHFIPSGIGGMRALPILCKQHNQLVAKRCDAPLCAQLALFVHSLKVVKARGEDGVPMTGSTADGERYTIDRNHRPAPTMNILERDVNGRPVKARAPTMEAAEKLMKSMGIAAGDPNVIVEKQRVTGPTIQFAPELGGADGFRGILKIAYEYVRGFLEAQPVEVGDDEPTRNAIIGDRDPAEFVRWLPYEHLPSGEAAFFSHRLCAWQSGDEVLVIVELFNTMPFVVRLPGLRLPRAACYIQGVKGEEPLIGTMPIAPSWTWNDIPEHAQPLMFAGFEERLGTILQTRALAEVIEVAKEVFEIAVAERGEAATDEELTTTAKVALAEYLLKPEQKSAVEEALTMLVAVYRAAKDSAFDASAEPT